MTIFEYISQKFSNFGFADVLQILIIALVIAFVLIYAKNHNARIFSYFLIAYFAFVVLLSAFKAFSTAVTVALICAPVLLLVVLFGPELKRDIFKISWKNYSNYIHNNLFVDPEEIHNTIQNIIKAAQSLSKQDIGALIIVVPDTIADHILESGTRLDAEVSSALLESIFFKNTPLHDGAVIIKGSKILAAGCYLPLSQSLNIPKELGTRHRGAIGITEANPSVTAIVVSEETGIISAMYDGRIARYLDSKKLEEILKAAYMLDNGVSQKTVWRMDINEEE